MHYFERLFPFGKFKNVQLQNVDTAYLIHSLENFELSDDLIWDIKWMILFKVKGFQMFQLFLEDVISNSELKYTNQQIEELVLSLSNNIETEDKISNFK
jgi:hypothetical protein